MEPLLARLALALPPRFRPGLARQHLCAEFLRFGVVGTIGFCFDTATVYATRRALGLYGAGVAAYFIAATVNWGLNRAWTFRGRGAGPAHRQWMRFLAANLLGFTLNRGTYAALIATSRLAVAYPVLAVAAGSLAGMLVNFTLSRRLVFR